MPAGSRWLPPCYGVQLCNPASVLLATRAERAGLLRLAICCFYSPEGTFRRERSTSRAFAATGCVVDQDAAEQAATARVVGRGCTAGVRGQASYDSESTERARPPGQAKALGVGSMADAASGNAVVVRLALCAAESDAAVLGALTVSGRLSVYLFASHGQGEAC